MATELDFFTEQELLSEIGQQRFNLAQSRLAAGSVVNRFYFPSGKILGFWNSKASSPQMYLFSRQGEIFLGCTCGEFGRKAFGCQHLDVFILAWLGERSSFTEEAEEVWDEFMGPQNADFVDLEDLGEDDLLAALLDDFDDDEDYNDEDDEDDLFDSSPISLTPSPARAVSAPVYDPVQDYQRMLSGLTLPELREVARRRGVPISGQRKDPIVESLASALAQPGKLAEDWEKLSPEARQLVGIVPFLTSHYMQPSLLKDMVRLSGLSDQNAVESALEELRQFGILFVTAYGKLDFSQILSILLPPDPSLVQQQPVNAQRLRLQLADAPRALLQKVMQLLLLLQSNQVQVTAHPVKNEVRTNVVFLPGWPLDLKDMERITRAPNSIQALRRNGVKVVPAGSPLQEDSLKMLAERLQEPPDQIDWLIRVLAGIDALALQPGKPVQARPEAVKNILQMDPLLAAKTIFAYSSSMNEWTELDLALARHPSLRFLLVDQNQGSYSRFLADLSVFRQQLFFLIRRQPVGQWVDLGALADYVHRFPMARILESLHHYGRIEIDGKKLQLNQPADWKQLFSYYIEAVISGPFFRQGLVDLAWNQNRLSAFRLTDFGAAVLVQRTDYQLPVSTDKGAALSFTQDGGLVLNLEAAEGELVSLVSLLGELELSSGGEIIYRPTISYVARAFEAGWTAEKIEQTLQAAAGQQPLPAVLSNSLNRWWQNFGSLQIYGDVALIEFGDDFALKELLAGTSLPRYLLYRFSSRLVAIRPEGVEALRDEMVKKGYTPRVDA